MNINVGFAPEDHCLQRVTDYNDPGKNSLGGQATNTVGGQVQPNRCWLRGACGTMDMGCSGWAAQSGVPDVKGERVSFETESPGARCAIGQGSGPLQRAAHIRSEGDCRLMCRVKYSKESGLAI